MSTNQNKTTNFIVGKTYYCRSICDHECIFTYEIVKRTEKTVWIKSHGKDVTSRRVKQHEGNEMIFPEGQYSMCPVLHSDREATA